MRDRDGQQSAQGGSLHTPTTDHSTQLITAHAHDHHSSYSSRARVAIAMRLMFSGASSNHLVFAASTGAVSGPNRVPLEGAQYSGSPCQSSSRDSIVRHVAWPTGSCGFPCAHMWQELVRGFQHARRRVAAWSDPAPTAFAWALDTSAGRVAFCSRIDTRTAVSWAYRPPRLPPRGNTASRRPGLRYVVRPRGLLVCLTTGRSHTARASRAHLVTAARAGDLLLLANDV